MRRRFDIPLANDGAVRFLPWIMALMIYLAGLALAGTLLIHGALGDWNRGLTGVMTVELPPAANASDGAAEMKLAVALLEATKGVVSVKPMPRAAVAKLIEPWLAGAAVDQLPLPRLIDVRVDNAHRPDVADLRAKLATAAPGAVLDDAQLRFARLFDLGVSVELTALVVVVLIGIAAILTTVFTTRAGLAVHQNVIEILHILGAHDTYIARQFARQALGLGVRGGLIGFALAIATLAILGHAADTAAILGPGLRLMPSIVPQPWQWAALILLPVAAGAIAYFTALATVMRELGRMP